MLPYIKRLEKREILVKTEAESDSLYGKRPEDRTVEELLQSSIININKPKGPTSHQVSEFVKKILNVKKAGQSGTLDPAVTGVLPVGINKATKSLQALLNAGKEYVCLMHIHKPVDQKEIEEVCKEYTGTIKQLPPIKSAVKRRWRYRTIYYIDILEISENKQDVLFRVGCQAGTYIRKLCDDMGKTLGCGAHMAQLLRTQVGTFKDDSMHTLQELENNYNLYKEGMIEAEKNLKKILLPVEKAIEHLPKIWIFDTVIPYICNGADLALPGISKYHSDIEPDEMIAILSLKDELVAIGFSTVSSTYITENQKGIIVKTDKVFMPQDIYLKRANK